MLQKFNLERFFIAVIVSIKLNLFCIWQILDVLLTEKDFDEKWNIDSSDGNDED